MTNTEFIISHREDNVVDLALKSHSPEVDLTFCLQQIEGWQLACKKLPVWASTEGILYPPRLSMEQCSSQLTAEYKQQIIRQILPDDKKKMLDLTGGFGVDFSYLASLFKESIYVEQQAGLCDVARHNFPLLGLNRSAVICSSCEEQLLTAEGCSLIFLDPARRDNAGKKVFLIEDCTPNVCEIAQELVKRSKWVMLKLSPMLDIKHALLKLPMTREVHVVSVDGECKELLLLLSQETSPIKYHCVNISKNTEVFSTSSCSSEVKIADTLSTYLYEPNSSILKTGVQDALCAAFNVEKLHPFSHLFCSSEILQDFPGRKFRIVNQCDFSKQELKTMLKDIKKANLAIRNFPSTVAELRKKLNLKEGGDIYLFATTLANGKHILIQCERL